VAVDQPVGKIELIGNFDPGHRRALNESRHRLRLA
jgi:hypothetical protein